MGGLVFLYNNIIIPKVARNVEQKVRAEIDDKAMPKARAAVIVDEGGINKYTLLTDEIIDKKIKIIDIPVKYMPQHAVADADMLKGKITKEDLHFGQQIVSDSLTTEKKWFGEYERLKEFKVSSIVAGEVRTGNIIDIIVSYDNGDYDIVVPRIKVKKLVDEAEGFNDQQIPAPDGKVQKNEKPPAAQAKQNNKKSDGYTLVLAVDEEQYRDLELASKLGRFVTRLYIDESQPPSKKTFDYAKGLEKLNIQNASAKVKTSDEVKKQREEPARSGEPTLQTGAEGASNNGQFPEIQLKN